MSQRALKSPLIFIDTNVLLDFYRERKSVEFELLNKIDNAHNSIICTYQVEMEFKKNRQSAFAESLSKLALKMDQAIPPAYLATHKSLISAKKDIAKAKEKVNRVRNSHLLALGNPTLHDPVYKTCQRLFVSKEAELLSRDNPNRKNIRRLALKRFTLGYPPRKAKDTSIGDALNWEWIIDVASENNCDVIIVSRDPDFGIEVDGKSYINDWLQQEFRDRVGKNRQVILTKLLSKALKTINVDVTEDESQAEEEFVEKTTLGESISNLPSAGSAFMLKLQNDPIAFQMWKDGEPERLKRMEKYTEIFEQITRNMQRRLGD